MKNEVEKNVKELKKEKMITILCKREAKSIFKNFFIAFAIVFAIVVVPTILKNGFQSANFVIALVPVIMFVVTCVLRMKQVSKSQKYENEIQGLSEEDFNKMYDELAPEINKDYGIIINLFSKIPEIPIILVIPGAIILSVIISSPYWWFFILTIGDLLLLSPTATGKLRKGHIKDPRTPEQLRKADEKREQTKIIQERLDIEREIQKKHLEPTSTIGVYRRGDGAFVNSHGIVVPTPTQDKTKNK